MARNSGGYQSPMANAGVNQTVRTRATVSLERLGKRDSNSHPLTYQWSQTSGPAVTLSSTTAVQPTFTAPSSPSSLASS